MSAALQSSCGSPRWAVIRDARRRQRRRRRRLAAVLALVTSAAVAWTAGSRLRSSPPAPATVTVGSVSELQTGGVVQGTTTLGRNLWVLTCRRHCTTMAAGRSAGELVELTAAGRTILRVPVADPTALTSGDGNIWVAHLNTGDVTRVDPTTGATTAVTHLQLSAPITPTGWRRFEPANISYGAGGVWASDGLGFVAEVNPRTALSSGTIFTSSEATSTATAGGLTWVADELNGVGAFTAGSHRVTVHPVSWNGQPVDVQTVTRGGSVIWAFGAETDYRRSLTKPPTVGVVSMLDPRTGHATRQWHVPPSAEALVTAGDRAYVGDDATGRLLVLIPGRRAEFLRGPRGARLTAATSSALWAIDPDGHLMRIALRSRADGRATAGSRGRE